MSAKKYYYFPPRKAQFYFPKKTFNKFKNYYTPFSFKAKLFWLLFLYVPRLKDLFVINENKLPLHFNKIKEIIEIKDVEIFYNTGTLGPEQKTTAIAKNKTEERFIKFGVTSRAKKLIDNEARTLKILNERRKSLLTPRLMSNYNFNDYSYLITNVIDGTKLKKVRLSEKVFDVLIEFPLQTKNGNGLYQIFSHGDFCPWNLLVDLQGDLVLIDWEMAGYRPLGYDLFTFVFQTHFLINPRKEVKVIFKENNKWIKRYFNHFKISNYRDYLHSFVKQKVEQEGNKPNKFLFQKYSQLLNLYE